MEQLDLLADDQLARELLAVIRSPTLCQAAKVAEVARLLAPYGLAVRPATAHHCFTASDIAKELGVSAQAVGKLATRHQLKTDQYGEYRLTKSPYSTKQVESFVYNEAYLTRKKNQLRMAKDSLAKAEYALEQAAILGTPPEESLILGKPDYWHQYIFD